jgi:hypothetical protein
LVFPASPYIFVASCGSGEIRVGRSGEKAVAESVKKDFAGSD